MPIRGSPILTVRVLCSSDHTKYVGKSIGHKVRPLLSVFYLAHVVRHLWISTS